MRIDFSGVKDNGGFSLVEEGGYNARVTRLEKKTSQTGNLYLSIGFTITDEGDGKGRQIWENYPLSEKALWKFKQLLDAAGLDTEGEVEFNPGDLMGQEVHIEVGIGPDYKGVDRNKVPKVSQVKDKVANGFDF